jgi:hypothetical protein
MTAHLSPTQAAVLTAASDGVPLSVAAARLGVPRTRVASELSFAYRALGVDWMPSGEKRAAAVRVARAAGLIGDRPEDARMPGRRVSAQERTDLAYRALERAAALVDRWSDDPRPIARAEAAGLLAEVIRLHGWMQTDARPGLAAVGPVEASGAPGPRRDAAGRSGDDGAGSNGSGRASSRAGDSRSDPSEAENALRGGSPGLAAPARPSPRPGP